MESRIEGKVAHVAAVKSDCGHAIFGDRQHFVVEVDPGAIELSVEVFEVAPGSTRHIEQRFCIGDSFANK